MTRNRKKTIRIYAFFCGKSEPEVRFCSLRPSAGRMNGPKHLLTNVSIFFPPPPRWDTKHNPEKLLGDNKRTSLECFRMSVIVVICVHWMKVIK